MKHDGAKGGTLTREECVITSESGSTETEGYWNEEESQ